MTQTSKLSSANAGCAAAMALVGLVESRQRVRAYLRKQRDKKLVDWLGYTFERHTVRGREVLRLEYIKHVGEQRMVVFVNTRTSQTIRMPADHVWQLFESGLMQRC